MTLYSAGMTLLVQLAWAEPSFHDQHVVFENSAAEDSYFHSTAHVVAPSELAQVDGKCPVESKHFVSPGNALRLKWKSVRGADWQMTIRLPMRIGPPLSVAGDTISLWCYSEKGLTAEAAPSLRIYDADGATLPDMPLLAAGESLPAGQWTRLDFPLPNFAGMYRSTTDSGFNPRRIGQIAFCQRLDDGAEHVLYVDDIRVVSGNHSAKNPSPSPSREGGELAAPTGLIVDGQDHHCDLVWKPSTGDVLSYRIYRSTDGKNYTPLATRPSNSPRCVDFLGSNKTAWYKVSAIDVQNNESPLSEAVEGTTRTFTDDELLSMVQRGCFRYYWDAAHPNAGMALEVFPGDQDLVALGGSGFGISALVVATERGFITREESVERLLKIVRFLNKADRFHGVWPHFLDGRTGKVWPLFGKYDNGGDLVETAFLMQGLLTARQYFSQDTPAEREIRDTITTMWEEVEWDWYRKTPDGEVLLWHWSPDHEWHISHPLVGWNETMIIYLLGIASPTHPIPASMYHTGWAGQSQFAVDYRHGWSRTTDGDHYTNGHTYYGHKLDVGCGTGGDLFFAQFSFLGFDPRGIKDKYTNYFHNNRQLSLVNRGYCMANPRGRKGYGPDCWGLSAGINSGGGKPQPRDDSGTICVSAALGVMPYTPEESLAALKHYYRDLGAKTWGAYGFHDGFNQTTDWYDEFYMGLNQAQIVVGIENHRSGLCWEQFMKNPEIKPMLDAIGFVPDEDERK
ncbi:MAG: glucoamylase family protein [Bythopirellula sp.]|nr:glucoamylase family protein [Bythopirellula sp.]